MVVIVFYEILYKCFISKVFLVFWILLGNLVNFFLGVGIRFILV